MRWRRRLPSGALLLLVHLVLCCAAGLFMAEETLHPGRRPLTAGNWREAQEMAGRHDGEMMDITLTAAGGAQLRGWSVRPPRANDDIVILLHGLSDNRMGMIGYAELLLSHDFSVLMPDARAHGDSAGEIATYGLLEADDVRRWFEWLRKNQHPRCIFALGESMGAAQWLEALRSEPGFCAIAAESSFSDFREIAYDRVGQFFHTGPWLGRSVFRPVVEAAFLYARWKYKLDLPQVSPKRVVAGSPVPVLLIHGRKDRNIPVRHAQRIAEQNP